MLSAGTDIGSSGTALTTALGALSATATAGLVNIAEADGITLGTLLAAGDIRVTSGGDIAAGAGVTNVTAATATLTAAGLLGTEAAPVTVSVAGALDVDADAALGGTVIALAGTVGDGPRVIDSALSGGGVGFFNGVKFFPTVVPTPVPTVVPTTPPVPTVVPTTPPPVATVQPTVPPVSVTVEPPAGAVAAVEPPAAPAADPAEPALDLLATGNADASVSLRTVTVRPDAPRPGDTASSRLDSLITGEPLDTAQDTVSADLGLEPFTTADDSGSGVDREEDGAPLRERGVRREGNRPEPATTPDRN